MLIPSEEVPDPNGMKISDAPVKNSGFSEQKGMF
jgi:hypothetical protein